MSRAEWKHGEGKRSHTLTHIDEELLNKGGKESAIFETAFLERPNHRMVIKRWQLLGTDSEAGARKICRIRAERAANYYSYFKRMHFPVPTTYRLHESEPEVLMTDLSQNGASLVLSPNNALNNDEPVVKGILSMEECAHIGTQIQDLVKRAALLGTVLGADVYFAIKKRTGEEMPRVMLGDFGGCEHYSGYRHEDTLNEVYAESMRKARLSMAGFLKQYSTLPDSEIETYLDTHGFPTRVESLFGEEE